MMMTIRSRLLALLLPFLIAFVSIISIFFYINWHNEILSSFKIRLVNTAVGVASILPLKDIEALKKQPGDNPQLSHDFTEILEQTGLHSIYLVLISPVKKGEPVLLNQPISENNPVFDGKNPAYAFRQTYLLDVSSQPSRQPGTLDFSETGEQVLYVTKRPLVTEEYTARSDGEHIITAYAPVMDNKGEVIALLGTDISMDVVHQKLKGAALVIFISAIATIILVILCVYTSAQRISLPILQVKSTALKIAAGDYGSKVVVNGPLEVAELANTLNTMSECLKENIERLKASSAARERLYGEYECALLLQERMFKKVFETFINPLYRVKGLQTQASQDPHGIYASFTNHESGFDFEMIENPRQGFEGIYELLQSVSSSQCQFPSLHLSVSQPGVLSCKTKDFPAPFLWKNNTLSQLKAEKTEITIAKGDLILIATPFLWSVLNGKQEIERWLTRVLKHFASDSLDLVASMLQQELIFLSDRHYLERDIFMVVLSSAKH